MRRFSGEVRSKLRELAGQNCTKLGVSDAGYVCVVSRLSRVLGS